MNVRHREIMGEKKMRGKQGVCIGTCNRYIRKIGVVTLLAAVLALLGGCGDPVDRMLNELVEEANTEHTDSVGNAADPAKDSTEADGSLGDSTEMNSTAEDSSEGFRAGERLPAEAATMHFQKQEYL